MSPVSAYIASNALAAGEGAGPRPATLKLFTLPIAIAGIFPASVSGTSAPSASARNAVCSSLWREQLQESSACRARFSQPSEVFFMPGVPDSM